MQQSMELKNVAMSQEHLTILNLIKNCPNEAITRKEIVAHLGLDHRYYRNLNSIVSDLVVIFGEPIGSSSSKYKNGYFYCNNDKEYDLAEKSLDSRVMSISERRTALRRTRVKRLNSKQNN